MKVLLTNDDGIQATGLNVVRRALQEVDDVELAVIAPDSNRSATARSITTRHPLWVEEVKFDDGTVTLKFDNASGGLAAYSTTSGQFESAAGVAVGNSIRPVLDERGDELVESPLGTGALVLSEGAPGSSPALTFAMAFDRNEIVEISGGAVVQPAGE